MGGLNVKNKLAAFGKGIRQWFDGLTVQGLLKFILLLVILHLAVFFFRPLPIHITHKTETAKRIAGVPALPKRVQPTRRTSGMTRKTQPSRTVPTRIRRPQPTRTTAPTGTTSGTQTQQKPSTQ